MAATLTETTLAGSIQSNDTIITLAAASGVQPGWVGYIDREAIKFLALQPFSTVAWNVARGQDGTFAGAHINAAKVKVGPAAYFYMYDVAGNGDAAKEVALPHINVITGNVFAIPASVWTQVGVGGVVQGASAWPA